MKPFLSLIPLTLPAVLLAAEPAPVTGAAAPFPIPAYVQAEWQILATAADKNTDGQVTAVELKAIPVAFLGNVLREFKRLDENQDGNLTLEEYQAYAVRQELSLRDRFVQADADSSGGLTREENKAAIGIMFTKINLYFDVMDADQNGEVTWDERMVFLQKPESMQLNYAPPGTEAGASGKENTPSDTGPSVAPKP